MLRVRATYAVGQVFLGSHTKCRKPGSYLLFVVSFYKFEPCNWSICIQYFLSETRRANALSPGAIAHLILSNFHSGSDFQLYIFIFLSCKFYMS